MKSACCVCSGGRSQRDYSGPLSGIHSAWEKPPQPMLPKQHAGKTPTHLTQCCVCKDEAVRQALVGASAERTTEVNANMRINGVLTIPRVIPPTRTADDRSFIVLTETKFSL